MAKCTRRPRVVFHCSAAPASPEKPRLSGKCPNEADPKREVAVKFFLSLGLSTEASLRLPARLPKLCRSDLPVFAEPTLAFLRSHGLSPRQVARAVRNAPQIFFRPREEFAPRIEFLENVARIPKDNLKSVIAKCPHVLWMDLKNAGMVTETVIEECPRISLKTLSEVFLRVPQVLIVRPNHISANIDSIRQAGVSDAAGLSRIIGKAPLALVYDTKKNLAKRLDYLSGELGFSKSTIGKILVSTPEILEWSVEKKIKPKTALLQSLVGDDHVAAVIETVPSILGVNDVLDPVLWLRDDVGLSDKQVQKVLREAPAVLTYSVVGNLAPKWTFIHETMGATVEDLVAAPREVLCANLQQRAMPRYAFLASHGKRDVAVIDVLRGSDAEFCKEVAKCDAQVFRSYVDNDTYLLFFSRLM